MALRSLFNKRPKVANDEVIGLTEVTADGIDHQAHSDIEIDHVVRQYRPPGVNRALSSSSREIRLLHVDAVSASSLDAPVTGYLRVVDLDDYPDYQALSYVWGAFSSPEDTINCEGVDIPVTSNCLSAIQHLRQAFPAPLVIWIDAICIDQENEEEKLIQIPLMSAIYSRARHVTVWLGPGTTQTDLAMDGLSRGAVPLAWMPFGWHRIALPLGKSIPTGRVFSAYFALRFFLTFFRGGSRAVFPLMREYRGFLRASWVERLWTFQEAVLAPNIHIVCGNKVVPWICVLYSIEFLAHWQHYPNEFPQMQAWLRLTEAWKQAHWETAGLEMTSIDRTSERLRQDFDRHKLTLDRGILWFEKMMLIMQWLICLITLVLPPALLCLSIVIFLLSGGFGFFFLALFILSSILPYFTIRLVRAQKRGNLKKHDLKAEQLFRFSFAELLGSDLQHRKCSQDRDRYFGLFSLLRRGGPRSAPDHTHTSLHVTYRLLFRDIINYTKSLDLLLFTNSRLPRGPSWVVDWRRAPPYWVWSLYDTDHPHSPISSSFATHATRIGNSVLSYPGATYGSETRWKFHGNNELHVWGHVVGTVVDRVALEPSSGDGPTDLKTMENMLHRLTNGLPERTIRASVGFMVAFSLPYNTANWILSNFVRHMIKIMTKPRSRQESRRHAIRLIQGVAHSLYSLGYSIQDQILNDAQQFIMRCFRRGGGHLGDPENTAVWILNNLSGLPMALIRCSSEVVDDFGPGPDAAREGDIIALISGVPLPMVLRRRYREGYYDVVGPVSLQSTMTGEVWKQLDEDRMEGIILV